MRNRTAFTLFGPIARFFSSGFCRKKWPVSEHFVSHVLLPLTEVEARLNRLIATHDEYTYRGMACEEERTALRRRIRAQQQCLLGVLPPIPSRIYEAMAQALAAIYVVDTDKVLDKRGRIFTLPWYIADHCPVACEVFALYATAAGAKPYTETEERVSEKHLAMEYLVPETWSGIEAHTWERLQQEMPHAIYCALRDLDDRCTEAMRDSLSTQAVFPVA